MWQLTIPGRVPTKKNSKRIVRTANGRTFLISSKAHDAWHDGALLICRSKRPKEPLAGPLILYIKFYMKGRLDADVDNLVASIQDLLTDSGIFADDRQIVELHAVKLTGQPDFSTELRLAEVQQP